jgi:hypothetical protein
MPIMPRASMSAPTTPHLPMSRSMDSLPLAMNNRYAKHGGKFNMDTVWRVCMACTQVNHCRTDSSDQRLGPQFSQPDSLVSSF